MLDADISPIPETNAIGTKLLTIESKEIERVFLKRDADD